MQHQLAKLGLTKRQREYLDWIEQYFIDHDGGSPSYEEIGHAMGCKISAVQSVIKALVKRGHLIKLAHQPRSLALPAKEASNG